jgi:uncharacterized protein
MPYIDRHNRGDFCWFELGTTDQSAAKAFYTSLFAWTFDDSPIGPDDFYTIFKLQERDVAAAYTLRPDQRSQGVPANWMVYVQVESADDTVRRAGELGAKVLAPAFDVFNAGPMAALADPTGAIFSVWQAKAHSGTGLNGLDGTVCWADLSTSDVDKAKQFYRNLLGWQITRGEDVSGYLHIKNGQKFIGGIPPAAHRNPQIPPQWMIYFLVSNCDASADKARQLGAQLLLPPQEIEDVGRMAFVEDPLGATFALFQATRR